jgi:hypothetical protein
MSRRARRSRKADSLAAQFEDARGREGVWAEQPTAAKVRKHAGVVFSIRFSPAELRELRGRAAERGITVSEFIRRAVLVDWPQQTAILDWMSSAGPEIFVVRAGSCQSVGRTGLTFGPPDAQTSLFSAPDFLYDKPPTFASRVQKSVESPV